MGAGLGEGFACFIEGVLDRRVVRMLRAKHPSPFLADFVERFHSLDEIIERGVFRVGTVKTRLSPHFGGFTGFESDSEDTQRGHELRCTYGLAAVREEQERWLASINRQCWASFDPSGEIREAARSFKNL